MNQETKIRTDSQKEKILKLLRLAGSDGIMNSELSKIALRYSARIQELYVAGYNISVDEYPNGLTKYILISEPEIRNRKPKNAIEILKEDLENRYDGSISSEDLFQYLEEKKFTIKRKIGSFCNDKEKLKC